MHYVYVIQSIKYPEQIYVGHTHDFEERLANHNNGSSPHTAKYRGKS